MPTAKYGVKHLITDEQWASIQPVFIRAWPREAVVAIWDDNDWQELENIAEGVDAAFHFKLSQDDNALLLKRKPRLLLHSHPHGDASPSDQDTVSQIGTGWNWGIVAVEGNIALNQCYEAHYPEIWGPDAQRGALLGRTYLWGIRDCWTICADWYAQHGVELDSIPRVREPGEHHGHERGRDPFHYWTPRLGFKQVQRYERRFGDLALMTFKGVTANHCAVYLGNGTYLHQGAGSTSQEWIMDNEEKSIERQSITFWRNKQKIKGDCL